MEIIQKLFEVHFIKSYLVFILSLRKILERKYLDGIP